MIVYFARHAECHKNLIGIPGGCGTKLTARGVAQAELLGERLRANAEQLHVFHTAHVQAEETAKITAGMVGANCTLAEGLHSISLGRLSGVPISEASLKYPHENANMDLWRNGAISFSELDIVDMEDGVNFMRRSINSVDVALSGIGLSGGAALIVCTTSHLILFRHLRDGITPLMPKYKSISFDYCEIFSVEWKRIRSVAARNS